MKIYWTEENRAEFRTITGTHEQVTILGQTVSLINDQDQWKIHVSYPLYIEKKSGYYKITHRYEQHCAHLWMTDDVPECRFYQTNKRFISIGSDEDDDISLPLESLSENALILDLQENKIRDLYGCSIGSMKHKVVQSCTWKLGDCLRLPGIAVVFGAGFLMVEHGSEIQVHLDEYHQASTTEPVHVPQYPGIRKPYRRIHLNDRMTIDLDEPLPFQPAEKNPLIFSMGPALMMSSASLSVGLFAVYNGYNNGRMITEMLPMIMLPAVMLLSTLLWHPLQRLYEKRKDRKYHHQRIFLYEEYLDHLNEDVQGYKKQYQENLDNDYPASIPGENIQNLWDRSAWDSDYFFVRLGRHTYFETIDLNIRFRLRYDDPLNQNIREFCKNLYKGDNILMKNLKDKNVCVLTDTIENTLTSLIGQLLVSCDPDDLHVMVQADLSWFQKNLWLYSIPHVYKNQLRLFSVCEQEYSELLQGMHNEEQLLVILIGQEEYFRKPKEFNYTRVLFTENQPAAGADLIIDEREHCVLENGEYTKYIPDNSPSFDRMRFSSELLFRSSISKKTRNTFLDLYQTDSAQSLRIEERWAGNSALASLAVPIGFLSDGQPVYLDLHEKGHGPHGLVAGTTGSGKSELIMTLILSLAVNYSPKEVQFVLIDFKGGGLVTTFCQNDRTLPHLAGVLTNLDGRDIERALFSFQSEIQRREKLFAELSESSNQPVLNYKDYRKTPGHEDLAEIVIIIDEFAELKKEYPQFLKDLISISRVGRSLGIHLILSTQKPGGIVDEQIWSNSHFKICLKVQEKSDSKEVLHTEEASYIRYPGEFCLLCDDLMVRGRGGYVNASADMHNTPVKIVDHQNKVLMEYSPEETCQTQIQVILEEILKTSTHLNLHSHPLWLERITYYPAESAEYDTSLILGKADLYCVHKIQDVEIDPEEGHALLIYGPEQEDRRDILRVLFYGLLRILREKDEVFVIDDFCIEELQWARISQVIDIVDSQDEEKIMNLWKHLEDRQGSTIPECIVILTDLVWYLKDSDAYRSALQHILELRTQRKVTVIALCSDPVSVPYKTLSLFDLRIALKNDDLQSLTSFFEKSIHYPLNHRYQGLFRKGDITEFTYPYVTEQEMEYRIQKNLHDFGKEKRYRIMKIPDRVEYTMYSGIELPLGIDIETYQWITADLNRVLYVISVYEEEYEDFYQTVKQHCPCTLYEGGELPSQGMVFMSCDMYKRLERKPTARERNIFFIGAGFQEQYIFHLPKRIMLKSDQGVYYRSGKINVVKYVQNG